MPENHTTKNVFSEEGRLLHAEFANKNVSEAGTIAGMVCTDGVLIIGINQTKSKTIEKLFQINDEVHVAVSGIFSDALRLIKYARLKSYNLREQIGQDPKLSVLCDYIGKEKQRYTQIDNGRPFGVSFLCCGYEDGNYVLYSTEPSGTVGRWRAKCFGMDSDSVNSGLRNIITEGEKLDLNDGLIALLSLIKKAREFVDDISLKLEILLYSKNDCRMLDASEIKEFIKKVEEITA